MYKRQVQGRVDLGMSLVDINDAQTAMMYRVSSLGVFVLSVSDGSNAAKAGIQSGDRVISVDGQKVSSTAEINQIIEGRSVGDSLKIKIERNGRVGETSLTLQEYKGGSTML